ncbi:MAG: HIT domain-containing protein [Candidatus Nanoarchaeia archaeon]|nr:HIT domain-containing protein [Candidatus Nanoarchaeia archaeon]
MVLSDSEIENIKEKLLSQTKNLPLEKRKEIENQIKNMSSADFEKFLEKNDAVSKCLFCSILEREVESIKIYEDNLSIYVLDINPLSYGHTLVIPKNHGICDVQDYKEGIEYISEIFKLIFVPNEIKILSKSLFGHTIFEIVPDYGEPLIKKKVDLEELNEIKNKFESFLNKFKETLSEDSENNFENNEDLNIKESSEQIQSDEFPLEEKKEEFPKFSSRIP